MSNLKLPTMTFEALSKMVKPGKSRKLAYATEARRSAGGYIITIFQHGNTIAVLTADSIYVDNCGYDTTTTATRLRKILADNDTGYYVRIKNYAMRLYNDSHTELEPNFRNATLTRGNYGWFMSYGLMNQEPAPVDLFAA